jgi:hypothetical protein
MKRVVSILAATILSLGVFAGCAKTPAPAPKPTPEVADKTDAMTTASIVNKQDAFLKATSKEGTWIIATLKDLTVTKDIVLEGEFKNGKKDTAGKELIQRKIALYTQDDKRNVTARFTLTAPKITIKSPVASIQHGTFKGDIYVETADFQLIDTKVEGNVYFKDAAAMAGFKMDATSSVSGKKEVKK